MIADVVLPFAGIGNEFTDPSPFHNALCGQECEAAISVALSHPRSADQFAADIAAHGWNQSTGTLPAWLASTLTDNGLPARVRVGPLGPATDAALNQRHYGIYNVQSDSSGNPKPVGSAAVRHWIVVFGKQSGLYHFGNPGGGRIQTIPLAYLESCDLGESVEVMPPAPQGDDMSQADVDAINAHTDLALQALASKDAVFALAPGQTLPFSGALGTTALNLTSWADVTVTVIAYALDGMPIKSVTFNLVGNRPNVKGPVAQFGTVKSLFGVDGPVTLVFFNGTNWTTLTIH